VLNIRLLIYERRWRTANAFSSLFCDSPALVIHGTDSGLGDLMSAPEGVIAPLELINGASSEDRWRTIAGILSSFHGRQDVKSARQNTGASSASHYLIGPNLEAD
jgi:hypothetical protein